MRSIGEYFSARPKADLSLDSILEFNPDFWKTPKLLRIGANRLIDFPVRLTTIRKSNQLMAYQRGVWNEFAKEMHC